MVSGVTFLRILRSKGLLFRKKGSMDDLSSLWGPNTNAMTCSWSLFVSILGGIFDQKSIKKTMYFLHKLWYGFWAIFDLFLEAFWINIWWFFDNFLETAISWKWAPLQWKINIFKVWRLRKSIKNRSENGIENNIDFWIEIWLILDWFWRLFGSKNRSKNNWIKYINSGVIYVRFMLDMLMCSG